MPISQAHEQENAYVKDSGGCVGLTENPTAFRPWAVHVTKTIGRRVHSWNWQSKKLSVPLLRLYSSKDMLQKQVNSLFKRMGTLCRLSKTCKTWPLMN